MCRLETDSFKLPRRFIMLEKKNSLAQDLFLSDIEKFRRTLSPRKLYADCEKLEAKLVANHNFDPLFVSLLFGKLFLDQPGIRPKIQPFHTLVAPPARLQLSLREWRYGKI